MVTKLRTKIIQRGIPQYMVAALSGMAPSRVSEYCNGQKVIPAHHLVALARTLQCNPHDLVGEDTSVDVGI